MPNFCPTLDLGGRKIYKRETLVQCILETNARDIAGKEAGINEQAYQMFGLTRE